MKSFIAILFCLTAIASFGQTRRIEHRSHSGSDRKGYYSASGSYGVVAPRKVKVHLESGRDTMVDPWDSLARPYYLDPNRQPKQQEGGKKSIENVKQVGHVAGKMIM